MRMPTLTIFTLLVALVCLAPPALQAQPTAQLSATLRGYDLVFEDTFDSYTSLEDFARATVVNPNNGLLYRKWHIDTTYVWRIAPAATADANYKSVSDAWCNSKENVAIAPLKPGAKNRVLVLKSTYHSSPLVAGPDGAIVTPKGAVITGNSSTGLPARFYRSTAAVSPQYYNSQAPGYDNQGDCGLWMHGFRYGILQIRCKLPRRPGIQGAFWMFGGGATCASGFCENDPDEPPHKGWEIDGFESYDNGHGATMGKRIFFSTLQPNILNGYRGTSTFFGLPQDPAADYHTYTLAWTPTGITWFVDGQETRTDDTSRGIPYSTLANILSSHYMWNYSGSNDESAPPNAGTGLSDAEINNAADTDFLIDWIKVWKPTAGTMRGTWPAYKSPLAWRKKRIASLGPGTVAKVAPVYRNPKPTLYYTSTSGRLGQLAYNGTTWVHQPDIVSVWPNSEAATDPVTHKVFFAGADGFVCVYENGQYTRLSYEPAILPNATDDNQVIAYDPEPHQHGSVSRDSAGHTVAAIRVYYTTGPHGTANGNTGPNQLWYYELTPNSAWKQYSTNLHNVAGPVCVVSGRVYYRGSTDNNLWCYGYEPGGDTGRWTARSLNPGCYPADVAKVVGGVAFNSRPDGDRVFYLTNDHLLKYYEYTAAFKQEVTVPAKCTNEPDAYRRKYEDGANTPASTGYCAGLPSLPHWRLKTTGQTTGAGGTVRHFNNQLLFVDGQGGIKEFRHFKRWNGNRLDFAPTAAWYTNLGPVVESVRTASAPEVTEQLFGMDDHLLYTLDADGNIWRYSANEVLNPVTNEPDAATPLRPR